MDDFMNLICPNSPSVWDVSGLSKCYGNILLGFGANVVTLGMISVLGITQRTGRRSWKMNFSERLFLHVLPAIGACMSFFDIALLLKKDLPGVFIAQHEWFFRCSQFAVWTVVILFSRCFNGCYIFCNRILCFWWIVKIILATLHLFATYPSFKVLLFRKEICSFSLDVMFGISINIIRMKRASSNRSSMEDSLLSADMDMEEGCLKDNGNTQSYFDLVTFRSITSVMNNGVTKQLEFEDLLQLPTDMDPCSCHDALLSCWQSQQSSCPDPSLFRAICSAYGWPYLRLGLLKIDWKSRGEIINITECNRSRSYLIAIGLGCATWLIEQLKKVRFAGEEYFFKRYRGNNYQFWVESLSNRNGSFLKLSQSGRDGFVKSIFLPKGRREEGWQKMEEHLENFMFGDSKDFSGAANKNHTQMTNESKGNKS